MKCPKHPTEQAFLIDDSDDSVYGCNVCEQEREKAERDAIEKSWNINRKLSNVSRCQKCGRFIKKNDTTHCVLCGLQTQVAFYREKYEQQKVVKEQLENERYSAIRIWNALVHSIADRHGEEAARTIIANAVAGLGRKTLQEVLDYLVDRHFLG